MKTRKRLSIMPILTVVFTTVLCYGFLCASLFGQSSRTNPNVKPKTSPQRYAMNNTSVRATPPNPAYASRRTQAEATNGKVNGNGNGAVNGNGNGAAAGEAKAEVPTLASIKGNPKVYTGISKPLPGERRFTPETAVKPKGPIPGTAVRPIIPSVWYPGVSRSQITGPLDGSLFPTLPAEETGGPLKAPELVTPAERYERQYLQEEPENTGVPGSSGVPGSTGVPAKESDTVMSFEFPEQTQNGLGLEERLTPTENEQGFFNQEYGLFNNPHPGEVIYGEAPMPRPSQFQPAFGDAEIPLENMLPPTGPPRALWYGKVENPLDENGEEIIDVLNAPFAPGQAAPKVYSNGREVTMSERARLAEGRAPIIRGTSVMAAHTHVATRLPQFNDGLEHCPVCCRAYLCGCGDAECRFCNPDSRIGPAPVCSNCGDAKPCIHGEICAAQLGHAPYREGGNTSGGIACPICKEAVERVPCGCCDKCLRGETCELYKPCGKCPSCLIYERCDLYRAHRNCIVQARLNSCSRCDNAINGEPCGTCDWCQQNSGLYHEPCGHQELGIYKTRTIYNPYNERPLFSAPPRWITDRFTNRSSKFPIYYNPAPYYKNTHNPSMYGAHQRPYMGRYTCDLCRHEKCTCTAPGNAGMVAYAYACKFCDRNPCACAGEICNANATINPSMVRAQREELRKQDEAPREWENAIDTGFIEDDEEEDPFWKRLSTFDPLPTPGGSDEVPDFGEGGETNEEIENIFNDGPGWNAPGTQNQKLKPLPKVSAPQPQRQANRVPQQMLIDFRMN